ncbi:uncharacterized protein LOC129776927 [Toxorhynchites rutilus septentrionalis]|uniref:uncharacterized protein LOC129776927 n=1 Tax=Toxorhynchites rutilus septentrionalis TaxID=329112 RepID=UPI00247932A0|nr:uncharacterized protein LOC129776927 [Toxorhynchites rutilus septentrionalis]
MSSKPKEHPHELMQKMHQDIQKKMSKINQYSEMESTKGALSVQQQSYQTPGRNPHKSHPIVPPIRPQPIEKKTFEQAYREAVERLNAAAMGRSGSNQNSNSYHKENTSIQRMSTNPSAGSNNAKSTHSYVNPLSSPSTSSTLQNQYKTTVYNINTINLAELLKGQGRTSESPSGRSNSNLPNTYLTDSNMQMANSNAARIMIENNKYQQTFSNAYANHLLQMTKSAVKKTTEKQMPVSNQRGPPAAKKARKNCPPDYLMNNEANGNANHEGMAPSTSRKTNGNVLVKLDRHTAHNSKDSNGPGPSASYASEIIESNVLSIMGAAPNDQQLIKHEQNYRNTHNQMVTGSQERPSMGLFPKVTQDMKRPYHAIADMGNRPELTVIVNKPRISSPAPAHVYGKPTDLLPISTGFTERAVLGSKEKIYESNPKQNSIHPGVAIAEPPPAHSVLSKSPLLANLIHPSTNLYPSVSTGIDRPNATGIRPEPNNRKRMSSGEGALNLDIKDTTITAPSSQNVAGYSYNTPSRDGTNQIPYFHSNQKVAKIEKRVNYDSKTCNSDTTIAKYHQNLVYKEQPSIKSENQHNGNTGINEQKKRLLELLHNANLQQLFTQVQAHAQMQSKYMPNSPRFPGINSNTAAAFAIQMRNISQMNMELYKYRAASLNTVDYNNTQPRDPLEIKPEIIRQFKRKDHTRRLDAVRRRKPKLIRCQEPYLQNGPCYEVAPRLPRCRECGRSAAARSRDAANIFCRFIAFRKLKYNELGQMEVVGFADPDVDPQDTDTRLWNANLSEVPIDLSVEKSKFLLGQVGYKFCELFHQEKEAYFEHMSADKTIAWKQAVQGVREMCDVCSTTLFNYHWVCSTCGFVVCIDCYKGRKHGTCKNDTIMRDRDGYMWLNCTNKEPHLPEKLMLTQIIPSNSLYKLVRQMHGICALLEIPLNCECPLSKESLFRKIKDKLEFILPITIDVGKDANGADNNTNPMKINNINTTKMISITIKNIQSTLSRDTDGTICCKVIFGRELSADKNQENELMNRREKQSYSFEGFQEDIKIESLEDFIKDGELTDDEKTKGNDENSNDIGAMQTTTTDDDKTEMSAENSTTAIQTMMSDEKIVENDENPTNIKPSQTMASDEKTEENAENPMDAKTIQTAMTDEKTEENVENSTDNKFIETESSTPRAEPLEDQEKKENSDDKMVNNISGKVEPTDNDDILEVVADGSKIQGEGVLKESNHPEEKPYSDKHRFRPSPKLDWKTFNMIVKQLLKFDKSINISGLFEKHLTEKCSESECLVDFTADIQVNHSNIQSFLHDFLDEFVFLKGQNSSDNLTDDKQIMEYNRHMKNSIEFQNKGERTMNLHISESLYPNVAHQWLCNGRLLRLLDPLDNNNYTTFHDQWERGQPVMVSHVSNALDMSLWYPHSFGHDFGDEDNDLINCLNGKLVKSQKMKIFWEGFERIGRRLLDERDRPMVLKLKDWPPGDDFAEMMPTRFSDLMKCLPLAEYTRREGRLNLASRLSSFFVRPDLGPKMYSAYGSALHPSKGTTNLHLDISDAVNIMVYVGVPKDVDQAKYAQKVLDAIDADEYDAVTRQRINEKDELPGAVWHIYHAKDADKIRSLLNKIEVEKGGSIKTDHDPIHDQKWYLDANLRKRLLKEYNVEGYSIVQCSGDAIFIPAGAPHQVRNLHNCIKVAEDFVSPENISYCFKLTNEFRHLTHTHSNHEDKLQIKNIIYHTVKDAVSCLTNPLIMTKDKIDVA